MISEEAKETLRGKRLFIGDTPSFPNTHVSYPDGSVVVKPTDVEGNGHLYYESVYSREKKDKGYTNSPRIVFWQSGDSWSVEVSEYVPSPGPGDFKEVFATENEAVRFILSYFFDAEIERFLSWYSNYEKISNRKKVDAGVCLKCGKDIEYGYLVRLETVKSFELCQNDKAIETKLRECEGLNDSQIASYMNHRMGRHCEKTEPPCPKCGSPLRTWHSTLCLKCKWRRDPDIPLPNYYE